jgi:hypothetical protein
MITPNLSIKFVSIYFFFFGFLSLIYLHGINKLLGIFLIYYAYVNLLCLRNKGKKLFKLAILKLNIAIIAILTTGLIYDIYFKNKKDNIQIGIVGLLMLPLITNYLSIRNYKF